MFLTLAVKSIYTVREIKSENAWNETPLDAVFSNNWWTIKPQARQTWSRDNWCLVADAWQSGRNLHTFSACALKQSEVNNTQKQANKLQYETYWFSILILKLSLKWWMFDRKIRM